MVSAHKFWLIWWILTGTLLGVGFWLPWLWPLGLIGGASYLYLIVHTKDRARLYIGAWVAMMSKAAWALLWIWSTYPVDWLGDVELGSAQLFFIGSYWIIPACVIGLSGIFLAATWVLMDRFLYIRNHLGLCLIIVPGVWVVAEVVGSLAFSVLMYGPGGNISSSFSFGYTGYLLAENDWLVQVARIGGVYTLSALFAILSLVLWRVLIGVPRYIQASVILLVIIVGFTSPIYSQPVIDGVTVLSIDTDFSNQEYLDPIRFAQVQTELQVMMVAALAVTPDYIILPEEARFFDQTLHPSRTQALFQFQYKRPSVIIVDTSRVQSEAGAIQQAYVFNGINDTVTQFSKRYLVPQGEYLPLSYETVFRAFGYDDEVDRVKDGLLSPLSATTSQASLSHGAPGVLFCFESVDPRGVKKLLAERPDLPFVAHPMSHGWFHDAVMLPHQLDVMLRVQAVWNQTHIVSAGRNVTGRVFRPSGEVSTPPVIDRGDGWLIKQTSVPEYDNDRPLW